MQEKDFQRLVNKYLDGDATPLERELVEAHMQMLLKQPGKELTHAELLKHKAVVWEKVRPLEQDQTIYSEQEQKNRKTHRVHRIHFIRRFGMAAAAVLILALSATWLVMNRQKSDQKIIAGKVDVKAPDANRAMITLSNGQRIYLDVTANGQLATEGSAKLVKLADGRIAYSGSSGGNMGEDIFNTLTNPNGSKVIDMVLSDGSRVWLNAGSSIIYPVVFAANKERRVRMTGEAYYEIAHRNDLDFVVQKENTEIKVMGTHFNVKAYDNEPDLKVTLLEGSVQIKQNSKSLLLKPNQQAVIQSDNLQLVADADTEQAVAWKNNVTSFHSANVATVMREIERWYNIQTEIKGNISERSFYADVPRTVELAEILKVLELNKVKYEYDAAKRKLTVLP